MEYKNKRQINIIVNVFAFISFLSIGSEKMTVCHEIIIILYVEVKDASHHQNYSLQTHLFNSQKDRCRKT